MGGSRMATAELGTKPLVFPGHLDLPSEDGTFVQNNREHPQSILLTDAILPLIRRRHPDGQFLIGQDMGIYWRWTDPPLDGVKAPDWYYVPDVPATLDGDFRRSYVLWRESIAPLIIIEFASDDGSDEHDATPSSGKFWVYERAIRPAYYAIFLVATGDLEVYRHVEGRFEALRPNQDGRFSIPQLGVELGVWEGYFINERAPWLRWYETDGTLVPTSAEVVERDAIRMEALAAHADAESRRADALAARLRVLGVDPDEVAGSA